MAEANSVIFHTDLRRDKQVKALGMEEKIRELYSDIRRYVSHFNQGAIAHYNSERNSILALIGHTDHSPTNTDEQCDSCNEKSICKSIEAHNPEFEANNDLLKIANEKIGFFNFRELDERDATQIAYSHYMFERNITDMIFFRNPLSAKAVRMSHHFFRGDSGKLILDPLCFDSDTQGIEYIFDGKNHLIEPTGLVLDMVLDCSLNYLSRELTLKKYSASYDHITNWYASFRKNRMDEFTGSRQIFFSEGISPNEIDYKKVQDISSLLYTQSKINSIRFIMLYAVYLDQNNAQNPLNEAKLKHGELVRLHDQKRLFWADKQKSKDVLRINAFSSI